MQVRDARKIVHSTLEAKGFQEVGPGSDDYEGALEIRGKRIDVSLSIPDLRFAQKPIVRLKDRTQIPMELLAHVENNNGICYSSAIGLPLDLYHPGESILRVLAEVSRTLELSYRSRAHAEFVDEYQSYWHSNKFLRLFFPRHTNATKATGKVFSAHAPDSLLFEAGAPEPKLRGFETKSLSDLTIWRLEQPIGPAGCIATPDCLQDLKIWFDGQAALISKSWSEALSILVDGGVLLFAAPNACVGASLSLSPEFAAGVNKGSIRKAALPDLVMQHASKQSLTRYSGVWCNISEVIGRNSTGQASFEKLSIALIGCGTIGSHLARMLVQSGAGISSNFTIIDNDILSIGNIGRHLLGFNDIGKNKAVALKAELKRFHPQVQVNALEDNAIKLWGKISSHNLIIDATGDWNVQNTLNQEYMNASRVETQALLHCWVVKNGAAVQSFMNLRDEYCCFRCLKPQFDGPWRYPADNNSDLNQHPATCGEGSYIPFTVDASIMAASIAIRAALDWAGGRNHARLRTVVIDSARGRIQKPVSPKPAPSCPACASLRRKSE